MYPWPPVLLSRGLSRPSGCHRMGGLRPGLHSLIQACSCQRVLPSLHGALNSLVYQAMLPRCPMPLARIIHERFYCNRGYAAVTGSLALQPFDILHEYASGLHASECPSRFASARFRNEPS
jgi:hypothetical protein